MVVKTTYDKINISFCVERNKVSVLAEHLPKIANRIMGNVQ